MVERRPSASAMPIGIEATMPVTEMTSVTRRPPHSLRIDDRQPAAVEPHDRDHEGDAGEGRETRDQQPPAGRTPPLKKKAARRRRPR